MVITVTANQITLELEGRRHTQTHANAILNINRDNCQDGEMCVQGRGGGVYEKKRKKNRRNKLKIQRFTRITSMVNAHAHIEQAQR